MRTTKSVVNETRATATTSRTFSFSILETSRSRLNQWMKKKKKNFYFKLQTDSDCLRRRIVISHL